jgi:hypothetical protein
MAEIKAQTIETLNIVWRYKDALSKEDLVRALTDLLPDGAMIIDLAIDVATRTEPDTGSDVVMRTFKLTFATRPLLKNMRW